MAHMNLLTFTSYLGVTHVCHSHLKSERSKLGVTCKKCSNAAHHVKKDKECDYQVNQYVKAYFEEKSIDFSDKSTLS